MTINLLSFPFRIGPNGSAVTRPDDSMEYYAELLGVLIGTKPGERDQVPLFGLSDPVFAQVNAQELQYKVGMFGPPVRLLSVTSSYVSATQQEVKVEFASLETDTPDYTVRDNT